MPTGPQLYQQAQDLLLNAPTPEEVKDDDSLEERWTDDLCRWADQTGDKMAAYRAVYRAAEAREKLYKEEAARFTAVAKREKRTQESLEQLATLVLMSAEEVTGEPVASCADGSEVKLRRRKQPKIISINLSELPEVYIRRKPEANKVALLQVLKAGEEVPGVEYDAENRSQWVHWGP